MNSLSILYCLLLQSPKWAELPHLCQLSLIGGLKRMQTVRCCTCLTSRTREACGVSSFARSAAGAGPLHPLCCCIIPPTPTSKIYHYDTSCYKTKPYGSRRIPHSASSTRMAILRTSTTQVVTSKVSSQPTCSTSGSSKVRHSPICLLGK